MPRRRYPSDLTDAQWMHLEPMLPAALPGGRPRAHPTRELVDALRYVLRGGIAWRALPARLPALADGLSLLPACGAWMGPGSGSTTNCARLVRERAGRNAAAECRHPRQPVGQDHGKRGPRGYDGAKKLNGRKRHLLVDTSGLVLNAVVHRGRRERSRRGQAGARRDRRSASRRCAISGSMPAIRAAAVTWIEQNLGLSVTVVRKPRRWIRVAGGPGAAAHCRPAFRCCHGAGWWNAPSPGWGGTVA